MSQLVLLRHGQSVWNAKNLFTGWVDVPLSPKGIEEALSAGRQIQNISFDVIFMSDLVRAQLTAMLAMSVHDAGKEPCIVHDDPASKSFGDHDTIPTYISKALNERMYGELQGMNKDEARAQFGKEQVHIWRRSFATPPPGGESLKDTAARTLPYFETTIATELNRGKNVLISAHGNSLRAIVMHIEKMSEEEILHFEIPTGQPIIYTYEQGVWRR